MKHFRSVAEVIILLVILVGCLSALTPEGAHREKLAYDWAVTAFNESLRIYSDARPTMAADKVADVDPIIQAVNNALDIWWAAIKAKSGEEAANQEYLIQWTRLVSILADYGIQKL